MTNFHDFDRYPYGDDWYKQVPNVHRWLNGDRSQPCVREYPHEMYDVDFWFAPYYVMQALLGWPDTAEGVAHLMNYHSGSELDGPGRLPSQLPEANGSWTVHVVSKDVGFIGSFQRCVAM